MKKHGWFSFVVLLLIMAQGMAWALDFSVTRTITGTYGPGETLNVTLQVTDWDKVNGVLIKEKLPTGWTAIYDEDPYTGFFAIELEGKDWRKAAGVINYTLTAPTSGLTDNITVKCIDASYFTDVDELEFSIADTTYPEQGASHAAELKMNVAWTNSTVNYALVAAADNGASDLFNASEDVPVATPAAPGVYTEAYFTALDANNVSQSLKTDVHALAETMSWTLKVKVPANSTATVTWGNWTNSQDAGDGAWEYVIYDNDNPTAVIDMESTSKLTVANTGASVKTVTYTIRAAKGKKYVLTLKEATANTASPVEAGKSVTVTAAVPTGARFVRWTTTPALSLANATPATFTMPGHDQTIEAIFSYPLTVSNATVKINGVATNVTAGTPVYCEPDDQIEVTATVADGTQFFKWTAMGVTVANTSTVTFRMPKNAVNLEAVFKYQLTVNGGTPASGYYAEGENISVTPTVATGTQFFKWTATGITLTTAQTTANPLTITMPKKAVALTAVFKYQLTVNGGTGSGYYAEGANISVSATVASGTQFFKWTATGVTVTDNANVTFTMPKNAVTLTAVFKYQLTVNGGTGSGYYAEGANVSVSATVASGTQFFKWTATGVTVANTATVNFTMPKNAVTLTAVFKYQLTVTGGTPSGNYYEKDASVTVTATVDATHVFKNWTATGITLTTAQKTANPVTITMPENAVMLTSNFDGLYTIEAIDGTANPSSAIAGTSISITADTNKPNATFDKWTSEQNITFADATKSSTSFNMIEANVTVKANYKYAVIVDGTEKETHAPGETVTITAPLPAGSKFNKWTAVGLTLSNTDAAKQVLTFTMPANFVELTTSYQYLLTVNGGTPTGNYYTPGQSVTITATETDGVTQFNQWTATGLTLTSSQASAKSPTIVMPSQAVVMTASFKYAVTVDGTLQGYYAPSANVTVEAALAEGTAFVKWTNITGVTLADATQNPATFAMPANAVSMSHEFDYVVTTIIDGNTTQQGYKAGEQVTVTAGTIGGKTFVRWQSTDVAVGEIGKASFTFTMPAKGVTLTAVFEGTDEFTFRQDVSIAFGNGTVGNVQLVGGGKASSAVKAASTDVFKTQDGYLRSVKPISDAVWTLDFTVPAKSSIEITVSSLLQSGDDWCLKFFRDGVLVCDSMEQTVIPYQNESNTAEQISLEVLSVKAVQQTYTLAKGWNMVGLQGNLQGDGLQTLLDCEPMFINSLGEYELATELKPGVVYWIYSETAKSLEVNAFPFLAYETGWGEVTSTYGWNVIAPIGDVASWPEGTCFIQEWTDDGYRDVTDDTPVSGKGYWIFIIR
jgi:hypothetical protein